MLNTTNLVLLVGENEVGDFSPRKATIWKTNDSNVICSFWPFANKIRMAKLNKKRIILLVDVTIHIYSVSDMAILHSIDIGKVSEGKLLLSPNDEKNNYLCYSPNENEGIVKVYDLLYLTYKNTIQAHKSIIMQMAINSTGDKLVTASEKGTIIRVFSLPKGDKLFTFKRGLINAKIYSMNFAQDSLKLILSSETGTVHVFELLNSNVIDKEEYKNQSTSNGISTYFNTFVNTLSNSIISKNYEDMINYQRPIISSNFTELKTKNYISFRGSSSEAFAFNELGLFFLFKLNYSNGTINKLDEGDLLTLKLII